MAIIRIISHLACYSVQVSLTSGSDSSSTIEGRVKMMTWNILTQWTHPLTHYQGLPLQFLASPEFVEHVYKQMMMLLRIWTVESLSSCDLEHGRVLTYHVPIHLLEHSTTPHLHKLWSVLPLPLLCEDRCDVLWKPLGCNTNPCRTELALWTCRSSHSRYSGAIWP